MIGATSSDGYLPGLQAGNSGVVKGQLDAALEQQSTGLVSQSYGGLGAAARTTLDLRPQMQHARVWQDNVDAASGRLEVTQTVLKQVSSIAAEFFAQTDNLGSVGVSETAGVAASAKMALAQVVQLLNTKVGNDYVFAGQDTANAPIPVTDLATVTAGLLGSDVPTSPPFSATIGTNTPEIEVGEGQRVQAGLLANQNTLAVSAAPSTGSYLRDVMRALATLSGVTDGPGLAATAADTRARLRSAVAAMANEEGALGDVQAGLQTRKTTLAAVQTSLDKQISGVEDVDMAATLTRVQGLQTQLQASYQVIAGMRRMTLAGYL